MIVLLMCCWNAKGVIYKKQLDGKQTILILPICIELMIDLPCLLVALLYIDEWLDKFVIEERWVCMVFFCIVGGKALKLFNLCDQTLNLTSKIRTFAYKFCNSKTCLHYWVSDIWHTMILFERFEIVFDCL